MSFVAGDGWHLHGTEHFRLPWLKHQQIVLVMVWNFGKEQWRHFVQKEATFRISFAGTLLCFASLMHTIGVQVSGHGSRTVISRISKEVHEVDEYEIEGPRMCISIACDTAGNGNA